MRTLMAESFNQLTSLHEVVGNRTPSECYPEAHARGLQQMRLIRELHLSLWTLQGGLGCLNGRGPR